MSILTRDDLKTLYQEREGVCISIYMPTHPRATETDQGRIPLKNLLDLIWGHTYTTYEMGNHE